MTILILGSEGFIGSHCISYFLKKGDSVYGIDLYEQPTQKYFYKKVSRLSPDLDEFFGETKIDGVINAAGSGNVPYSMSHPVLDFEANSLDTIRVLDVLRKHQPHCKYIHLSSAAVYGNPEKLPILEEERLRPLSPYGWHKLISEQLCAEYSVVYNLSVAIIRPFSVYGSGLKKQLFWDLKQKIKNTSIELHGTGREGRDFIYIQDMVYGIDLILQKAPMHGETYNLASGYQTTIAQAVEMFMECMGYDGSVSFNNVVRAGDPLNWQADISKIKALGFVSGYSLKQGLIETTAWFKSVN